jgi:hypothetical protein
MLPCTNFLAAGYRKRVGRGASGPSHLKHIDLASTESSTAGPASAIERASLIRFLGGPLYDLDGILGPSRHFHSIQCKERAWGLFRIKNSRTSGLCGLKILATDQRKIKRDALKVIIRCSRCVIFRNSPPNRYSKQVSMNSSLTSSSSCSLDCPVSGSSTPKGCCGYADQRMIKRDPGLIAPPTHTHRPRSSSGSRP